MMQRILFALVAIILVASAIAATPHISNNVPSKVCSKSDGWKVFNIKNKDFYPPYSEAVANYLALNQMSDLKSQVLKEAAQKYNQAFKMNAKLSTKFGPDDSWILDGCQKVRKQ
jgi:hypothetical protein